MGAILSRFRGQPIFRLILTGFLTVALVPLFIVAIQSYRIAWDNTWRSVTEAHSNRASKLTEDISDFYVKQLQIIDGLTYKLSYLGPEKLSAPDKTSESVFLTSPGIHSLMYVRDSGVAHTVFHRELGTLHNQDVSKDANFILAKQNRRLTVSQLQRSILDGKPTVVVANPVILSDGSWKGAVLAELNLDIPRSMGRDVVFGKTGHAAIVDANGAVLSHPNSNWVTQMMNLSDLSVMESMIKGGAGLVEFESPQTASKMIAGYSVVSVNGWRVMIPQPKREVEDQVFSILYPQILWAGVGILFALLAALLIARWLTSPINQLAMAANKLTMGDFKGRLPEFPQTAPKEIEELGVSFRKLIAGLQKSRDEFKSLNLSLEARVQEATQDLQTANQRLEKLARVDDLTGLFNRRYFEEQLRLLIERKTNQNSQHVLIYADLDRFKFINDNFGHHTGDDVLRQFSALIASTVEPSHIVARIGGDEFTILMANSSIEQASAIAATIHENTATVSHNSDKRFAGLTVSMGVVAFDPEMNMSDVMHAADQSCYGAKSAGRNRTQVFTHPETPVISAPVEAGSHPI